MRNVLIAIGLVATSFGIGSSVEAQKSNRKHTRVAPPKFQPNEFSGVFFADPLAQLQGSPPDAAALTNNTSKAPVGDSSKSSDTPDSQPLASGNKIWKELISGPTIEDLIKESKSRVDGVITTPAKFAGGGYSITRREFTLLGSLMAVISQYPEEIRWKNSAGVARTTFSRLAANCKVGSQQVFNEAKLRQQDLQDLLKGSKLSGSEEELVWADTADRGPTMQLLEWALRENLNPATGSESKFKEQTEEVLKYAELIAMYGQILQQPGMTDADDQAYNQLSALMVSAALDVAKAARTNDAELARTAAGRIDQACNKCHDSYR